MTCLRKIVELDVKEGSGKHVCVMCQDVFKCGGLKDEKDKSELCKCIQELMSCCCPECKERDEDTKLLLVFFCDDYCHYRCSQEGMSDEDDEPS